MTRGTGIIRRLDQLGRIVIPKEIRTSMRIKEGDPFEIFVTNDTITFKKYSSIDEFLTICNWYVNALFRVSGVSVVIIDKNNVVAASGVNSREVLKKRISKDLENLLNRSDNKVFNNKGEIDLLDNWNNFKVAAFAPIISSIGREGGIMYLRNKKNEIKQTEIKLLETAALFLSSAAS